MWLARPAQGPSANRADADAALATEQGPAAGLDPPATFPRFRRRKVHNFRPERSITPDPPAQGPQTFRAMVLREMRSMELIPIHRDPNVVGFTRAARGLRAAAGVRARIQATLAG